MSQSLNRFDVTIASVAFLRLLFAARAGTAGDQVCGAGCYR
jgi:hypothetical protein